MQLTVPDVAQLLRVPEDTIYRWIREEDLPAIRFNDCYHFNRARLIEWAHERHIPIATEDQKGLPSLEEALTAGGEIRDIVGVSKAEVLHRVVEALRLPDHADREFLYEMLMSREQQGSTGFGGGIAIPHARRPILIPGQPPSITVGYLAQPVDFNAVDGRPVYVLFTLITPSIQIHLHLLSRLGQALKTPEFKQGIQNHAGIEELLGVLHGNQ